MRLTLLQSDQSCDSVLVPKQTGPLRFLRIHFHFIDHLSALSLVVEQIIQLSLHRLLFFVCSLQLRLELRTSFLQLTATLVNLVRGVVDLVAVNAGPKFSPCPCPFCA